jgi:hypothetical protein
MIYEAVDSTEPIQQGDIFHRIPRVDFTLSSLAVIDEGEELKQTSWRDILSESPSDAVSAVLAIKPVTAIVITQNCDAARGQTLAMCQIDEYLKATGLSAPKEPKRWQSLLIETSRKNSRFFYLPEDSRFNLNEKSAVDFRVVLPVPRVDLENMKDLRVARLNPTAREHFRESLSHFFRRYAYNEWYPLTRDELDAYAARQDEPITPYEWQK